MSQEMFLMVPSGQIVFREGDDGAEMYIIESGAIDILRAARGREPLDTLGPGDFFGEIAILEDQPRFANARSVRNALDRIRLRHATRLFSSGTGLTREQLTTVMAEDILASRVFGLSAPGGGNLG